MSEEIIKTALERIYHDKDEQIVIWYDDDGGFKDRFDALELNGIEKIEADDNLFWIKYRIYYDAPKNKYLIYIKEPKPKNSENWLLNIALSYYEFKADESSMNIQEFGLDFRLKPLLDKYKKFFKVPSNKIALKKFLKTDEDDQSLIYKMIAVCVSVKSDMLEDILYALISELHSDKETKLQKLQKYGLIKEFWSWVDKEIGYTNTKPTLMGLVIYLFDNRFRTCIKEFEYEGDKNASLFVNHWMQHIKYNEIFKALSQKVESDLDIKTNQLSNYTMEELSECDTYESIEQIIIKELCDRLSVGSISHIQITSIIDMRKSKFWYVEFAEYYGALFWAGEFYFLKENLSLEIKSIEHGLEAYISQWYKFDYAYRKYLYTLVKCTNTSLFDNITTEIEKFYANNYLTTLSDAWYKQLSSLDIWQFDVVVDQKEFYDQHVKNKVTDKNKLCVIISDALRYESGKELNERFSQKANIQTEFSYMVSSLPSYTQLGMASLLPHDTLSYKKGKFEVYADGISTQGTANRTKILQKHISNSIAIQASEFLKMKRDEARSYFKPYQLVYIYENSIDSRGKPPTEDQVFEATEEAFDRIMKVTNKMHNDLQWRNVIVTADHGYLYEKTDVDESNFCKVPKDDNFSDSNKRMAIGNNLSTAACVVKYKASQLNIQSETEFLIAKSKQRIRSKGGGSKFVHGGATLQEVIIPLIKVNRKTELKSHKVDFDVIRSSSIITSNLFCVTFLQKEAVEGKILSQHIQVCICSQSGEVLSDIHEVVFSSKEVDLAKMHQKVTFRFSKDMTALNNQKVILKIKAKADKTDDFNKPLSDKEDNYTINISFGAEEW